MFSLRDNIVSRAVRRHRSGIFRTYVFFAIGAFSLLSLLVKFTPYFKWDLQITTMLQKFNPLWFDFLMKLISFPGNGPEALIFLSVPVGILLIHKLRWEAICAGITLLTVSLAGPFLKIVIARARPTQGLVNVFLSRNDSSFPSGHVFTYTAYFGFLAYLVYTLLPHSRTRTILLITLTSLISLISLSRVYLGEHWPSDTLGAYLIGSVWVFLAIHLHHWGHKKFFLSPHSTPEETTEIRQSN